AGTISAGSATKNPTTTAATTSPIGLSPPTLRCIGADATRTPDTERPPAGDGRGSSERETPLGQLRVEDELQVAHAVPSAVERAAHVGPRRVDRAVRAIGDAVVVAHERRAGEAPLLTGPEELRAGRVARARGHLGVRERADPVAGRDDRVVEVGVRLVPRGV